MGSPNDLGQPVDQGCVSEVGYRPAGLGTQAPLFNSPRTISRRGSSCCLCYPLVIRSTHHFEHPPGPEKSLLIAQIKRSSRNWVFRIPLEQVLESLKLPRVNLFGSVLPLSPGCAHNEVSH